MFGVERWSKFNVYLFSCFTEYTKQTQWDIIAQTDVICEVWLTYKDNSFNEIFVDNFKFPNGNMIWSSLKCFSKKSFIHMSSFTNFFFLLTIMINWKFSSSANKTKRERLLVDHWIHSMIPFNLYFFLNISRVAT